MLAFLDEFERKTKSERAKAAKSMDGDLKKAVMQDMAAFFALLMATIAFRGRRGGVHSVRGKNLFCAFGWSRVTFPYRRGGDGRRDVFRAFGVDGNMTPCAAAEASRLGASLGSFAEAHDVMLELACGDLSESKIRKVTLAAGLSALAEQENPPMDVRAYTQAQAGAPEGSREVPRTLVAMADGTNAPCTKADTNGVRGKNGGEAGSRQLRVMSFCEYERVTDKGVPIPIKGSFSYAVTDGDAAKMTSVMRTNGVARGYGTVPRMQCVADGEEAIERAMRDAFQKDTLFTNDFMHASGYLSTCVNALGIADPDGEYKTCRSIMLRIGAGSAVKRIRRLYADELGNSEAALSALDYLDKRKENMRYGWLRKNGYYISSCHVEAAARILVARRCKQAGMHWRHKNAACVSALIAKIRSAA